MRSYAILRKQNKSRLTVVAILLFCAVLSASFLGSRLMSYVTADSCQYIPLTRSNGTTRVVKGYRDEQGDVQTVAASIQIPLLAVTSPVLNDNPGFEVTDDNTVWQGQTKVEIFRISYDNASGETTVRSQDGTKVLAPGTQNTYNFALKNTGDVSLDYVMKMEAYFSDSQTPIPVVARVTDYEGNYLVGSTDSMEDVLELNRVEQSGVIASGNVMPYTLQWEWPYESGDDAYDTMLGNLAVEEDISLTIVINTTASYNPNPDQPGGVPDTGDTTNVALLFITMVASMAAILILLLLKPRKEQKDETA